MAGNAYSNEAYSQLSNQGVMAQAQASALNKPREIGFLDRASGISSGLDSLRSKLETLSGRITGQEQDPNKSICPSPSGLPGILSLAEDHLRRLHQIIDELNGKL